MTVIILTFLTSTLAQPAGETRIGRFGPVGSRLSDPEITRIADFANAAGKPAWLILGFYSMMPGVTTLTVYLHPDVTTERIRRGRILRLVSEAAPAASAPANWKVRGTTSYAYVPPAGSAGKIASEHDLAWPFEVDGEFDDETLVSLVTFVRSRPPIPGVQEGHYPRTVVSAPLSKVSRGANDLFFVAMRLRDDSEVFGLTLMKKNGRWVITNWSWSIA